jgi:hypothetical protein
LTQNRPDGAIACHVSLLTWGRKPTSGGSNDTDVNDPIVKPAGSSPASPVTIVTPVGKWPNTFRNWRESNGVSSERGAAVIPSDGRQAPPRDTSWAMQDADIPVAKRALRAELRRIRREITADPVDRLARSRRIWARIVSIADLGAHGLESETVRAQMGA